MNHWTAGQMAQIRHHELTAAAAYHRQARQHRPNARAHLRRPLNAFQAWLAAGQL